MARCKPQSYLVADLAQADAALARLCEIKREMDLIDFDLNERIDLAKAEAAALAAPLMAERTMIQTALESFAVLKKDELTAKARSVDLAFGVIGFRRSKEVKPVGKSTWKAILAAIKRLGMKAGVRTKEEVDRQELLTWSAVDLEAVGAKVVEKDLFYLELKEEKVAEKAA